MNIKNYLFGLFLMSFLLIGQLQAQFKFGFGAGYSAIFGNSNYSDKFPTHGFSTDLEFGYLIKDHFEPGLRIGTNFYFDSKAVTLGRFTDIQFKQLANISVMPYLRYYFLENQKLRPYVIGALGYSYNDAISMTFQNVVGGTKVDISYPTNSFGTRIGAGIRLVKFLDLSLSYAYLGSMKRDYSIDNLIGGVLAQVQNAATDADIKANFKEKYSLHALELQLNFVFGGNLKNKEKKEKKDKSE